MDPLRLRAALESPALAMYRVFPTNKTTLAVHPTDSATLLFSKGCSPLLTVISLRAASPYSEPSFASRAWKDSSNALPYCPLLN